MEKLLAVCCLLLSSASRVQGAFDESAFRSAVAAKVGELGIPGAGVTLVFANETTPRSFGFGKANLALNTGVDPTQTLFVQASVSKIVPGTLAAILLSRGTIGLDTDINTYLGWNTTFRVRNGNNNITIRQLMTHSSGIVSGAPQLPNDRDPSLAPTGVNGAVGNPSCPLDKLEEWFIDLLFPGSQGGSGVGGTEVSNEGGWYNLSFSDDNTGLWEFGPGQDIEYSNVGSALLCEVLAAAHGAENCADLSTELLFEPLGMNQTSWFMSDFANYVSRAAMPYKGAGRTVASLTPVGHWCFIDYPSGQLRTTPEDMGKLLQVLLSGGVLANGTRIMDAATATKYYQCQTPAAAVAGSDEYATCPNAFQWFLDMDDNVGKVHGVTPAMIAGGLQHEGSISGVDTFAAVVPGADFAFAIMTNRDDAIEGLLPTVVRYALALPAPPASDEEDSDSSAEAPVGAIVGGVIGGIFFILIVAFCIFIVYKNTDSDGTCFGLDCKGDGKVGQIDGDPKDFVELAL